MPSLDILAGAFGGYSYAGTGKDRSGSEAYRWHWKYRRILWPSLQADLAFLLHGLLLFRG